MDDLESPKGLQIRMYRLVKEVDDFLAILGGRPEEWNLAAGLLADVSTRLTFFTDAVDLAVAASPPAPNWRRGGWIATRSGRKFWPLDPRPEEVDPGDIAFAVAGKPRFNAHVPFYSVGAHSLRVASMAALMAKKEGEDPTLAWAFGALHDSDEAYLPDIPRPIKPYIPGWLEWEDKVRRAVHRRFGLEAIPYAIHSIVEQADNYALTLEVRAFYEDDPEMWGELDYPNDPEVAEAGAVGLGEDWLTKRAVHEHLLVGLRRSVPVFDLPPEAVAGVSDTWQNPLNLIRSLTPPARAKLREEWAALETGERTASTERPTEATPRKGWLTEATPAPVDPRVERNKRRLEEGR